MPLPGGPADKTGYRYELWWTVRQLLAVLQGTAKDIRVEVPGEPKAEFELSRGGILEFHQAKRTHPAGKWSLASLNAADQGVLGAIRDKLVGNDARFVFVSASDAGELRELSERARDSESLTEFTRDFISPKGQGENFRLLLRYWGEPGEAAAYDLLRRTDVRTIDEQSLKELVDVGLRALFLHDVSSVTNLLIRIVTESVHKRISRDELIARLEGEGFRLRRLSEPASAAALVREATDRYLVGVRPRLIGGRLVACAATQTLLEKTVGQPRGRECALLGKAGSGKSTCILELVEALRARSVPVLAFRVDRLEPASTAVELGERLRLEESPALVLAAAACGADAVLVVDQLDAVSTASGRSSGILDAIEDLLAEVRGLNDRVRLHVVMVCRAFDWVNDHRLRKLLTREPVQVEAVPFTVDQTRSVLASQGLTVEAFSGRQLELLRLPQNLALFVDSAGDRAQPPTFQTDNDLFERYWTHKRQSVRVRTGMLPEQWSEVVRLLCAEMTRARRLWVPRESLDHFDGDYVHQMVSEGVLALERDLHRYAFGHESFFDYCFARTFVAGSQTLTDFLLVAGQELFRRAQVRQVLVYLRSADRPRYIREVRALLEGHEVRAHIKDLVLAVVVNVPDPDDAEWAILAPWLDSAMEGYAGEQGIADKLAALTWNHFFGSPSWFHLADQCGAVTQWLESDHDRLVDLAVEYLSRHLGHSGDRVAALLAPYVGRNGNWSRRFSYLVAYADLGASRGFFDLFLRLVDDGTLDAVHGAAADHDSVLSSLSMLEKDRPGWLAEALAHWLLRLLRLARAHVGGDLQAWRKFFPVHSVLCGNLAAAGKSAPDAFLRFLLPAILEIAETAKVDGGNAPPHEDAVWALLIKSEHESFDLACLNSLVNAFSTAAPAPHREAIDLLRGHTSFIANFLLLSAYAAAPSQHAAESIALLVDQPWRFDCGYSDSPCYTAANLITAVVPVCAPDERTRLVEAIMAFSREQERPVNGYLGHGCRGLDLLLAIPAEFRSSAVRVRLGELEAKFGKGHGPPVGIRTGWVGPPIPPQAADKMTDKQWLRAIAKYQSEHTRAPNRDETLTFSGGARELARLLARHVKNEPERFARLCLLLPPGTHSVYMDEVMLALKDTEGVTALKLDVCRKAFHEHRVECGMALADLLGALDAPLPEDAVEMLLWLATEHPDPERELWREATESGTPNFLGDSLTHGINTTRGRAAEAISRVLDRDGSQTQRLLPTIERLVTDKSAAVRSCAASILLVLGREDSLLAIRLLQRLVAPEEQLLGTHHVVQLMWCHLEQHIGELRSLIETMLRSSAPILCQEGARLACLATLCHESASGLAEVALQGNPSHRHGVADVAAHNLLGARYRGQCEQWLLQLFNDPDPGVRRDAAGCFHGLEASRLEEFAPLMEAFCKSPAFREHPFPLLKMLEDSHCRLPGVACLVGETFLAHLGNGAWLLHSGGALCAPRVTTITLRTYEQHQGDDWGPRCLDLLDGLCLNGVRSVQKALEDFER